jgi:type IV pilus assembly protein PilO
MSMNILEILRNMPNWQKLTILGVLVLIIAGVFYWYVYQPKTKEIKQLEAERDNLEKEIQQALAMQAILEDLQREVLLLEEQLQELLGLLPDHEQMAELLISVEGLATQTGLEVLSFNPQPEVPHEDFYGEAPVKLKIRGTYHELGKFFQKIANEQRILNIEGLQMREIPQTGVAGDSIDADFNCIAYWFMKPPVK